MLCPHLHLLEQEILAAGIPITYRGQAWSRNCREWIYVDAFLDIPALRRRMLFDACVIDHVNDDSKSGQERALVCAVCNDAVAGLYAPAGGKPVVG